MESYSKLREQALALYEMLGNEREQLSNGDYNFITSERVEEILNEHFPDFPGKMAGYNFILEGPLHDLGYNSWLHSAVEARAALTVFKNPQQRLQIVYWYASIRSILDNTVMNGVGVNENVIWGRNSSEYVSVSDPETPVMKLLKLFCETKPSKTYLNYGIRAFRELTKNLESIVSRVDKEFKPSGLTKIMSEGPSGDSDWVIKMEGQIKELQKQLPSNGLTSRTWGFEIESPDCKGVAPIPNSGIEKGDDGSLRSYEAGDDCECDCRDCTYHECNCDDCDSYNDDPDHCGDSYCANAESAEFRSTGGINRVKHNGMYQLCKDLLEAKAEINDTAGTHIHVYAQDLKTVEVGQVMAIYKRLENLFDVIAGRKDTNYARRIILEHIGNAIKKNHPWIVAEKPRAVNVSQLFTSRGTIEFRQMDCNYDADRITLFAWMVRGLVEVAKRGATLQSFMKVTDFNDFVVALGKFNYFLASEMPGLIIPGTKADANSVTKVQHRVVSR